MKSSYLFFVVIYISSIHYQLVYSISCLDEEGKPQDWYVLYKIPKIKNFANKYIQKGEGYVYLDANTPSGKWTLADRSVGDNSRLMRTVSQIGKNKDLSYIIYNDQAPISAKSGAKYGHTKGVLAVDAKSGFWIIHSIPHFPADPRSSIVIYPKTSKLYGQTALCITFDHEMLQQIVKTFSYTVPFIYAHHAGEGIGKLDAKLQVLFSQTHPKTSVQSPWSYITDITSHSGSHFKIFGKHAKFHKDLYGQLVAPTLKAPLRVETWSHGSGGIMPSSCNLDYFVIKIDHVLLNTSSVKIDFSNKKDHSKWATTEPGYEPYVCIGDINRVKSQWKRGGGTVCLKNNAAWKTFDKAATEIEKCKA